MHSAALAVVACAASACEGHAPRAMQVAPEPVRAEREAASSTTGGPQANKLDLRPGPTNVRPRVDEPGLRDPTQPHRAAKIEPEPMPDREPDIATVDVPFDRSAYVVEGNPAVHRPIVHLHGMCADPRRDLESWGAIAEVHGTVIALVGDVPCADRPGLTQWSLALDALDARVDAAIRAVSTTRHVPLDPSEVVLIGESMGASRAEQLASHRPDRYQRLVLVGSPRTPSPSNLRGARAVANLAGEREPQQMMREGTRLLEQAGTRARFWELPGASHGKFGPEGPRVMSEALSFVASD